MEIPEVASNQPQMVYDIVRTSFWAGHSDWEYAPVAARSQDGRTILWNFGEWQVISEASSTTQLPWNNSATSSESPKVPSDILSRTLLKMKILYNLTLLHNYSTLENVRYESQVKPSPKPLESGISVKTLCRHPHCAVSPTPGTHLLEEGGWKKWDKEKRITVDSLLMPKDVLYQWEKFNLFFLYNVYRIVISLNK